MARIAWGIMGDSRGHLTRALALLQEFPQHEFLFAGGGCVEELRGLGLRIHSLPVPGTILSHGRVRGLATAANFLRLLARSPEILRGLRAALEEFKPDLAVTDYEFFLPRAAHGLGLPCVSLDHQHVLTKCRQEPLPGQFLNRLATTASIRLLFSRASRFLVTSFFPAEPLGPDTEALGPILRRDILALTPRDGGHALAYLRTGLPRDLAQVLASLGREVRVYGLGALPARGPLRFLAGDRAAFLEDLVSCAFVLCNAGHNLLSEALFLGKPVLAMPSAMFYEQHVNAWRLRDMGRGDFFTDPARVGEALAGFERNLERFAETGRTGVEPGNAAAVAAVNRLLP
jgi:uncharacterized protein (TIGR00661 family)